MVVDVHLSMTRKKALKHPCNDHVDFSASVTTTGREAHLKRKRPCEGPSSASPSGRKALKCFHEGGLVNSASATTTEIGYPGCSEKGRTANYRRPRSGARKPLKRPLVNFASEMVVHHGREAHVDVKWKHPWEDQSFASPTAAASGTDDVVTGGSVFKILADRKALKCFPEEEEEALANSASATTTGTKAEVTGRRILRPIPLYVDPAAYAYDRKEIWYEDYYVGDLRIKVVKFPNMPLVTEKNLLSVVKPEHYAQEGLTPP